MPDGTSRSSRVQTARILYSTALSELPATLARARTLGFTHVNLPPPWVRARHDGKLARSLDRLDPAFAPIETLVALAEVASREGIKLVIDVVIDRLTLDALLEGMHGAGVLFEGPTREAMLDPRRGSIQGVASARLEEPRDALALGAWWAERLSDWHDSGIAGFRLLGLDRVQDNLLAPLVSSIRRGSPSAQLFAWTPGMTRIATGNLRGTGLNGVFASLPWWDFRAPWLWDELAALREVAPVFGSDAVPDMKEPLPDASRHRAMVAAAALCESWMHVDSAGPDAAADALAGQLNKLLQTSHALASAFAAALPAGEGGPVVAALLGNAADSRSASEAAIVAINPDPRRPAAVSAATLLAAAGGRFERFTAALTEPGRTLEPGETVSLPPGGAEIFTAAKAAILPAFPAAGMNPANLAAQQPRLAIERQEPCVDGGRFPVKRIAGEAVQVEADILFDGHEKIAASLRWRRPGGQAWHAIPMRDLGNDRWAAHFPLEVLGRHEYVVAAWRDRFETFRDELAKKFTAGVETYLELLEGRAIVQAAAKRVSAAPGHPLSEMLSKFDSAEPEARIELLLSQPLAAEMKRADDRPFLVETAPMPVDAERIEARFASWYEVFPRSMSDDPARHGTFRDVERHLPRIRNMGFDVLYFPPIHPIGRTNRKGPNNTLTPGPDDPGSPYAVGSPEGGHDALHPELGSFSDFQNLRRAAAEHGLELAMDFAIQCSPDHPWLREHKGWFDWRPDGTIRYAENPPKKYEDIVNVDFYAEDAVPGLWQALCDVVLFWADQGVRLFRVDNPHTKPFPFWEWMIGEVRRQYPDTVFLAEAFTRPKIMYRLAKIGFSQSYTYFTWRNTKRELEAYLSELEEAPARDCFRPHFFVNTPDINPVFLHRSGRAGFLIRAALAATLSGLWGVYSGFELCEATPVKPGKEEYLDSEKYQIRAWEWDRPGNIVAEITALNRIRRRNPALQSHLGVTFLVAQNDMVLYYEKATEDRSNVVLVAVSLDPDRVQEAEFELPLWKFGLPDDGVIVAQDQSGGAEFMWSGKNQRLRLTPESPYAIWRIRREDA